MQEVNIKGIDQTVQMCRSVCAFVFGTCRQIFSLLVDIYSNKKETSDFHGTVSLVPVKILQQK